MQQEAQTETPLAQALAFAERSHGSQTRKGKSVPYVSHLLQVAGLVLEYGGSSELAQAALLHDVLEDCAGTNAQQLRELFGERVTEVVEHCSDLLPGDTPERKSAWEKRKPHFLARLEEADAGVCLVVGCDKLHNLGDLVAELESSGREVFERFSASPARTLWYYQAARDALRGSIPAALFTALNARIDALAAFVPEGPDPV